MINSTVPLKIRLASRKNIPRAKANFRGRSKESYECKRCAGGVVQMRLERLFVNHQLRVRD